MPNRKKVKGTWKHLVKERVKTLIYEKTKCIFNIISSIVLKKLLSKQQANNINENNDILGI